LCYSLGCRLFAAIPIPTAAHLVIDLRLPIAGLVISHSDYYAAAASSSGLVKAIQCLPGASIGSGFVRV
jgi:hypothetical protein